jgi:segregation and condensation protein B
METQNITAAVEGILFASGEPLPTKRLAGILEIDEAAVAFAIEELEGYYNGGARGIRPLRMEDSVQLCSAPEYAEVIRQVLEKRRVPQLSPTALEVLSIVAYFQPVTRAYVERVRGVDSSYTMGMLQTRGLIEPCGQLQVLGRPTLFQTTKAFLRAFDLTKLEELPPLPELEEESEARTQLREAIEAIQREQEAQKQAEAMAKTLAEELRESLLQDEVPPPVSEEERDGPEHE